MCACAAPSHATRCTRSGITGMGTPKEPERGRSRERERVSDEALSTLSCQCRPALEGMMQICFGDCVRKPKARGLSTQVVEIWEQGTRGCVPPADLVRSLCPSKGSPARGRAAGAFVLGEVLTSRVLLCIFFLKPGPASQSEATRFEGVATLGGPPRPLERVGGRHNFTARADIRGSAR